MGNENSMLLKHGGLLGPSRRMSKAQSSALLSEIKEINRSSPDEGSLKSSLSSTNSTKERRTSGGAYIKKREQQRRKQLTILPASTSNTVEKVPSKSGRVPLEKQESSASSRGSRDESSTTTSGGGDEAGMGMGMGSEESSPCSNFVIPEETPVLSPRNGHLPGSVGAKSWLVKQSRKDSAGFSESAIPSGNTALSQFQQKRHRSASLCAAQMKADCQAIATLSYQHALNGSAAGSGGAAGRKASVAHQGVMPSLTRLRIQQGFRNAKPAIGHQILKRACTLRAEFKSFLGHLREDKADELAMDIYTLVTECVANVEMPSKVAATSFAFGEMHAQLCNSGFRPDFFSAIADATIAECVRLDGAQKRCETLMAWSQLMQFMFSNVRDGYYAEIRQQRRSSLPQQRLLLKQASIAKAYKSGLGENGISGQREMTPPNMDSCHVSSNRRERKKPANNTMLQQGISFDMNI